VVIIHNDSHECQIVLSRIHQTSTFVPITYFIKKYLTIRPIDDISIRLLYFADLAIEGEHRLTSSQYFLPCRENKYIDWLKTLASQDDYSLEILSALKSRYDNLLESRLLTIINPDVTLLFRLTWL